MSSPADFCKILQQLLDETGAELCRVHNGQVERGLSADAEDALRTIVGIAPLPTAGPNDVAFITNARFRKQLQQSSAGVVILNEGFLSALSSAYAIVHANPYWVYGKLACQFQAVREPSPKPGIAATAVIEDGAALAEGCSVGHGSVIKSGARIGAGCVIAEHCLVDNNVELGDRCRLSAGVKILRNCVVGEDAFFDVHATIGSEGFGYAPYQDNGLRWQPIAQLGRVVIGDRVSIGASTTVDRGALEDTVIGDDVIIDNQVQVAHNTRIGSGTAIAGCVGIAGSSIIGERCSIGGGAGIAGHLTIADDTVVLGMTLINKSVTQTGVYASGTGMQPANDWRKSAVRFTQLDAMYQRIRNLESADTDKDSDTDSHKDS